MTDDRFKDEPAPMGFVGQHLPGFVDPINIEREDAFAFTLDELLAIPWIAEWSKRKGFQKFVWSNYPLRHFHGSHRYITEYMMHAVVEDGSWVVGGMTMDYGLPRRGENKQPKKIGSRSWKRRRRP